MSFEKHVFAGKGTFEVTIPFDFKKADDVSVFFVISTGGVFDGTLAQLLDTGEVVSLTGRTYRFLGSEGVELHGVIGCESAVTVDARLLLRAVEELRSELKSVLRFPDKWVRKIHAYPAKKRMGKAIVFDADGQPTVGLIPGTEVLYELVETARKAADAATTAKGEIEKLALSAESSSKTAFELLQNMQQLSKKVIADADAALSSAKAEIVRIVSNAEKTTAEAQRAALEKISSAISEAERQCTILRDKFSDALAAGLKSIDEKISTACAAILAEISEYRYKVVTREEYETLKEAGTLEDEVIYFVRGTVDVGKLVLEWLEEGVGETPKNLENFQTFIVEKVANDIRDLEASTAEALLNRPTKVEVEFAISESEERTGNKINESLNSILGSIENFTVASTDISGTGKLGTGEVVPDTAGLVGMTGNGAFAVPFATDSQGGVVRTGGNGVGMNNNILTLNIRTTHSGVAFANRALYVNTGTDVHPDAGTAEPVGTDSAGRLCVPAIPLSSARLATPILNKAVLANGAYLATPNKVLCPAITEQGNYIGYIGTLEALGCPAAADIFPTEISLYRRGGYSTNGGNAMFLRILRIVDGAWTVAFESVNTVKANDFSENEAMTWTLRNKDGLGSIPSDEQIAIVQVGTTTLAAHATSSFGCKMVGSPSNPLPGAITANPTEDATVLPSIHATYRPAIDVAYFRTVPLSETVLWILACLEEDVVHREGDETIAGAKTFTSSLGLGGKTLIEVNVGAGVLKFSPVGSTAQTVLKRDGTNVVIQTQNAGVVQTTWTLPGGKTGVVALTSDLANYAPKSDYDALLARVDALEAAQATTEG